MLLTRSIARGLVSVDFMALSCLSTHCTQGLCSAPRPYGASCIPSVVSIASNKAVSITLFRAVACCSCSELPRSSNRHQNARMNPLQPASTAARSRSRPGFNALTPSVLTTLHNRRVHRQALAARRQRHFSTSRTDPGCTSDSPPCSYSQQPSPSDDSWHERIPHKKRPIIVCVGWLGARERWGG